MTFFKRIPFQVFFFKECLLWSTLSKRSSTESESRHSRTNYGPAQTHPKTLIEMWIFCLDLVSANSEKGRGSEWVVRVGQRLPFRFGQSGAARELGLVQIVVEASAIRGCFPNT